MMCMDVHCEEGDEDLIMYGDQGVSTEEHDKTTYGKLMKAQSEEEEEIKYNMPYALMIVCPWRRKEDNLLRICPTKMFTM